MDRRLAAASLLLIAACTWWGGETAAIKGRLDDLAEVVNSGAASGIASAARAARIATFFSEDAVVELGRGTAPIAGRDAIAGFAGRLEPRSGGFSIKLVDVNVQLPADRRSADVNLSVEILRRSAATGEPSLDAREFAMTLRKQNDDWVISRVTAVDTLKR